MVTEMGSLSAPFSRFVAFLSSHFSITHCRASIWSFAAAISSLEAARSAIPTTSSTKTAIRRYQAPRDCITTPSTKCVVDRLDARLIAYGKAHTNLMLSASV